MSEKNIVVVSDLHVGDKSNRDNFFSGGFNDLFLEFLNEGWVKESELIILGDFFEFWQANLGDAIKENLELIRILEARRPVYVVGNHDVDLQPLINEPFFLDSFFQNMCLPFFRIIGGKKFYFSHGHENDPLNRGTRPGIGRVAAIVAGYFEDKFGPMLPHGVSTEDFLHSLFDSLSQSAEKIYGSIQFDILSVFKKSILEASPTQVKDQINQHFVHMIEAKERLKFDVAVVGHTHVPGSYQDWYYNSGSWVVKSVLTPNNF